MYHNFSYEAVLAASLRAQWQLDDVLPSDKELDFSRNFLPETLAGTAGISGLAPDERRTLNQICAYQYLFLFEVFEESVAPWALANATAGTNSKKHDALINFADEEEKHIRLFKRYRNAFERGFPVRPELINSTIAIPRAMEQAHPVAGALFILLFEWMTQSHYVDSVRDDSDIDPLFKSLLKHHWIEEAQHAKLDTLIVDDLVEKCTPAEVPRIITDFRALYSVMNIGLQIQARYNVDALERTVGLHIRNRDLLIGHLYRTALWAFVGCGAVHPRFRATVRSISPDFEARVDRWTRRQFPRMVPPPSRQNRIQ